MFPEEYFQYMLDQREGYDSVANTCKNCGREIKVSIFKNGEWCSDDCRKVLIGEKVKEAALTDAGLTNIMRSPDGVNPRGII